jgi:hypothetical protein
MVTNGIAYQQLSAEEQSRFRKTYSNHPLFDYIDWEAYYNSTNGNAMDFVNHLGKYKDENGNDVYILERFTEEDEDYRLIFVCGENTFYKVPDTDD